jgi:transcription elongation GreA/GreB family factor
VNVPNNVIILALAPVGAALIGLSAGATIDWPGSGGKMRTLEVVSVEQLSREVKVPG